MTELGCSIDEFELDLFQVSPGRVNLERFPDGDDSLASTRDATLDHDIVVSDGTIVREPTHWCDLLVGNI